MPTLFCRLEGERYLTLWVSTNLHYRQGRGPIGGETTRGIGRLVFYSGCSCSFKFSCPQAPVCGRLDPSEWKSFPLQGMPSYQLVQWLNVASPALVPFGPAQNGGNPMLWDPLLVDMRAAHR